MFGSRLHKLECLLGTFALLMCVTGTAQAASLCSARFMHDGGALRIEGSGNLVLNADAQFSQVSHQGTQSCQARVTGHSSISYAGMPPQSNKFDALLKVDGQETRFTELRDGQPQSGSSGHFDLQLLGLFSYSDQVRHAGQQLPGADFQLKPLSSKVGGATVTVHIGTKTVGERKSLATSLGNQECWPISYTRDIESFPLSFGSFQVMVPAINSRVTDWYCPTVALTMQQDIVETGGVTSQLKVTQAQ